MVSAPLTQTGGANPSPPPRRQRVAPANTPFGVSLRLQRLLEVLFPEQTKQRRQETEREREGGGRAHAAVCVHRPVGWREGWS